MNSRRGLLYHLIMALVVAEHHRRSSSLGLSQGSYLSRVAGKVSGLTGRRMRAIPTTTKAIE